MAAQAAAQYQRMMIEHIRNQNSFDRSYEKNNNDEMFILHQYQQLVKICSSKMIIEDLKSKDWRVKAAANLAIGDLIAKETNSPSPEYIELLIDNLMDKKETTVQCARRSLIIASAKKTIPNKSINIQDVIKNGVDFGPITSESADKDNSVSAQRWQRYFLIDIKEQNK